MVVDVGQAVFLSFILMQFIEALIKPAVEIINAAFNGEEIKKRLLELWPLYLTVIIAGGLSWFTEVNILPMFPLALGKVLTCIGIGLGPSFLYDTFVDKPETTLVIESI
jgi:hypothetical protein